MRGTGGLPANISEWKSFYEVVNHMGVVSPKILHASELELLHRAELFLEYESGGGEWGAFIEKLNKHREGLARSVPPLLVCESTSCVTCSTAVPLWSKAQTCKKANKMWFLCRQESCS